MWFVVSDVWYRWLAFGVFFAVVCVALYKVSDNVYVQKAGICQLLFLAEIVPSFIFGRILPKTLFIAKNIEPSMNATSSCVPTAKSGFGSQKKNWHDHCQK